MKKPSSDQKFKVIIQCLGSLLGSAMVLLGLFSYFYPGLLGMSIVCGFLFVGFLINLRTHMILRFIQDKLSKKEKRK